MISAGMPLVPGATCNVRSSRRVAAVPSDRLKRNRAVASWYGKLAVRYEATLHIAAINEWL